MLLKISSVKCRQFCHDLNVLIFAQSRFLGLSCCIQCGIIMDGHIWETYVYINIILSWNYEMWKFLHAKWTHSKLEFHQGNVGRYIIVIFSCRLHGYQKQNDVLQWRHNERNGVLNYRRLGCLLSRLFKRRSNKASKLRVTGLCEGSTKGQ